MRILITASLLACSLSSLVSAQAAATEATPPLAPLADARQPGLESIDPEVCREWLTYLASDELEGRATGRPGYRKAAEFVAARFAEFGLEPVGDDGSYFQHVPFQSIGVDAAASYLALVAADGTELLRVKPGEGLGGRITEASERDVELVALTARNADDVVVEQVTEKAVLFVDQSPAARWGTEAGSALRRARPAMTLVVDDDQAAEMPRRVTLATPGNRARAGRWRSPNRYAVTEEVAQRMRAALAAADAPVTLRARIETEAEPAFGPNVLGLLRGSDPQLSEEVVGIGSHLDHIGASGDRINNGADDDGSGTTGVLAVARAFSQNPTRPRRSVLFMCFSGEEMGLVGSAYYADNPVIPNDRMVAELQMDMIGRNEERVDGTGAVLENAEDNLNTLHLIGTEKLSNELHELCLEINRRHVGFEFESDEEDVFSRSDHVNFAKQDIPIAFYFTGFHPQYHKPDDTVEKIDFPKLARVAQLVYATAFELADRDARPKLDRRWADVRR